MKVRIKTWYEMERVFGTTGDGDIPVFQNYTKDMEALMPSDRIIKIVKEDGRMRWNPGGNQFTIFPDMIAEYLPDEQEHPYHRLRTKEFEVPWWWQGKPVWCALWDSDKKYETEDYVVGIDITAPVIQFLTRNGGWYNHAEPVLLPEVTGKAIITRDGETTEIELSEKQIEQIEKGENHDNND